MDQDQVLMLLRGFLDGQYTWKRIRIFTSATIFKLEKD
jgi:hypothetical protein